MNSQNNVRRTVLVTGANGVLGFELVKQLIQDGNYCVLAMDRNTDRIDSILDGNENIKCYSTQDWHDNKIPFGTVDTMIHCAFARSNDGRQLTESIYFTKLFLTDAVANGVTAIINISSQSVYGRSQLPLWTEETPVSPELPDMCYAIAKYAGELLVSSICAKANPSCFFTNIRLASLSGVGLEERLTTRFVVKALKGEQIRIKCSKQIMAYLDLRDAVAGIIALIAVPPISWNSIYNLGYSQNYTLAEIVDAVSEEAGKHTDTPVQIVIDDTEAEYYSGMDSSLYYEVTKWQPEHDMRAMINSLFEYYANN